MQWAYLLGICLDGFLIASMSRRGMWRSAFFWYRVAAFRSLLLYPAFVAKPMDSYAAIYWPSKAIELAFFGWLMAEVLGVKSRGIGAIVGILAGIYLLNVRCPYDVYMWSMAGVVLLCFVAVIRRSCPVAFGVLLVALANFAAMQLNYGRTWLPLLSGVVAQIVWIGWAQKLPPVVRRYHLHKAKVIPINRRVKKSISHLASLEQA